MQARQTAQFHGGAVVGVMACEGQQDSTVERQPKPKGSPRSCAYSHVRVSGHMTATTASPMCSLVGKSCR
eukprot:2824982-Pyramimonas_sp.AAC.1